MYEQYWKRDGDFFESTKRNVIISVFPIFEKTIMTENEKHVVWKLDHPTLFTSTQMYEMENKNSGTRDEYVCNWTNDWNRDVSHNECIDEDEGSF